MQLARGALLTNKAITRPWILPCPITMVPRRACPSCRNDSWIGSMRDAWTNAGAIKAVRSLTLADFHSVRDAPDQAPGVQPIISDTGGRSPFASETLISKARHEAGRQR